jgi:hypothetical protein
MGNKSELYTEADDPQSLDFPKMRTVGLEREKRYSNGPWESHAVHGDGSDGMRFLEEKTGL